MSNANDNPAVPSQEECDRVIKHLLTQGYVVRREAEFDDDDIDVALLALHATARRLSERKRVPSSLVASIAESWIRKAKEDGNAA